MEYVEPVVVDTSSLKMLEPGDVPRVHAVPFVASLDLIFNAAAEPSFETVCVCAVLTVVVAVLRATEPKAIEPLVTETARLVAVTVATTVPVSSACARYPQKLNTLITTIIINATITRSCCCLLVSNRLFFI